MKKLDDYLYYEEKNPDLKIYLGDCLAVLPLLPKVDLVVTDPPYGINADLEMHKKSGQQYGNAAAPKGSYEFSNWDANTPPQEVFELMRLKSKDQIIFGGNFFELPPTRCVLVWDKQNGTNAFADCELAWTSFDNPIRIKRHLWNGMLRKNGEDRWSHPTQKPVEVIKWAIQQCKYWDIPLTILDPFLGSGTTLVACKELNRNGIGIEISEKYCEIAKKRLRATCRPLFTDANFVAKSLEQSQTTLDL